MVRRDIAPPLIAKAAAMVVMAYGVVVCDGGSGQQSSDGEIAEVMHFEPMVYPLDARVRSIEGAVVLRASFDGEGRVLSVTALSGAKALVAKSIENLMNWRFASPRGGSAVVVYWFQIRGVCEPPCPSGFEFYPPNVAVITMGRMITTQ